jgi:hypothetical protein
MPQKGVFSLTALTAAHLASVRVAVRVALSIQSTECPNIIAFHETSNQDVFYNQRNFDQNFSIAIPDFLIALAFTIPVVLISMILGNIPIFKPSRPAELIPLQFQQQSFGIGCAESPA